MSPTSVTRTRRSICRTMISMCLSLILHALEAVDLLDLVDQVLGQRLLAEHLEDVVRVGRRRPSAARRRARGRPRGPTRCLPLEIRYSFGVADLGRDDDLALALGVLAEADTTPSISAMMACSFGLRASKSSATRGRPPVMSLVFVVSRGIFAMTSPASMESPSLHDDVGADRQEVARLAAPSSGASASCRASSLMRDARAQCRRPSTR